MLALSYLPPRRPRRARGLTATAIAVTVITAIVVTLVVVFPVPASPVQPDLRFHEHGRFNPLDPVEYTITGWVKGIPPADDGFWTVFYGGGIPFGETRTGDLNIFDFQFQLPLDITEVVVGVIVCYDPQVPVEDECVFKLLVVPEPSAEVLLLYGLVGFLMGYRRRRK